MHDQIGKDNRITVFVSLVETRVGKRESLLVDAFSVVFNVYGELWRIRHHIVKVEGHSRGDAPLAQVILQEMPINLSKCLEGYLNPLS